MSEKTMEELFVEEVKDIYDAEKRILKALPKMIKKAGHDELREALENHRQETEKQIERLEKIFEHLGKTARGKRCKAMEGILEEGSDWLKEDAEENTLDAGMIGAAQKVEHYEIAAYGTLATWSRVLGYNEVTSLLEETLAEEKKADEKLTEIASEINQEAEEMAEEPEEAHAGE